MFTGIVEGLGKIVTVKKEGDNKDFIIHSSFVSEIKVDQSISHNGVCLTVTDILHDTYKVTAIRETLKRTNLGRWEPGDLVNLERCMLANSRFDGHIVQGHVDETAKCISIKEENGSWVFTFEYADTSDNITVEKGSICINGVSLTIVDSGINSFSVAIIPYTFEHTNFKLLKVGDLVNIEFDIIGKYLKKMYKMQNA